jgi:hypothetical protein
MQRRLPPEKLVDFVRKPSPKGENTHLPISDEFKPLLDAVVKFNKKKNKFPKKL